MIFLRKEKTIIFTPPKCGSTTLNHVFTETPNVNSIICNGPQLGLPHIEKHTNVLPFEVQNYHYHTNKVGRIAIAVRNPYTRALSIYNHYLQFDTPEKDINSFADFVKYRLVTGGHYFSQTLYAFCRRIYSPIPQQIKSGVFWPNYNIHVETLKEDIEGLGFKFNVIPNLNKTPTNEKYATMDDYTPEAIALVRSWGEMDFKSFGYYHDFDKCHQVKEKTIGVPVPPLDFMGNYGEGFSDYLQSGRKTFAEIKRNILNICNIDIEEQKKVLDFGCRAGRIIRNFDSNKEIHGVDLREDIIDWCKENLPYRFSNNSEDCNLPFENNYFDLIVSLSVFTHIESLKEWLAEITRILSKGGIFYLSIMDEEAVNKMIKIKSVDYINKLKKKLNFDEFLQGKHPVIWDGYFSFVQRDYFLNLMPQSMEIVGVGNSEFFQTAYIFRKK